jgi:HKD family nuclease
LKGDGVLGLFYWHSKVENGNTLKEELLGLDKISIVRIASAYFSKEGLEILKELRDKHLLKKQNIHLYLSPEFSIDKPYELLEELREFCNVYIVFNIRFHPKVYWLKSSSKSKLIFGSSNFTRGGFTDNIEFDMVSEINKNDELKLDMFFKYCNDNSELVNEEIIKFYKDKADEFNKLKDTNRKINKALYSYERRNDAFEEDDYSLDEMYFTYQDYETLFMRNQALNDAAINARRKAIKDKILKIHKKVYSTLNKENIHCHWRPENITSLIRPCEFNFGRVGWVGVRYGKHKDEIDILNIGSEKDEELGFQKHSCLQFCITSSGFEINLFHAVRRDAVDRNYLHENINSLKSKIVKELDKLRGEGLEWIIHDNAQDKDYIFKIDNEKSEDFISFYKKYDEEGRESYLAYYLEPDNDNLKDLNSISKVVIEKIKIFLPLYNLLAFRIK